MYNQMIVEGNTKSKEWKIIVRLLQESFERLNSIGEKPMLQATLLDAIETAKTQAKLWAIENIKSSAIIGPSDYVKE